jgi:polyisoprenoid-binding protein YceI
MKKIISIISILCMSHFVLAQSVAYKLKTLKVTFGIKNAGINVNGSFKTGSATLTIDDKKIENSKFIGMVKAANITTGNTIRDGHLKDKAEYFDVAKYEDIIMESTKIVKLSDGSYNVTWNITIKNIKKSITVPLTATIVNGVINLATSFTINRRDWNVGGKSMIMNDKVKISIVATAAK